MTRLTMYFRFVICVICYAISMPVFAVDYMWQMEGPSGGLIKLSTASAVCAEWVSRSDAANSPYGQNWTGANVVLLDDATGTYRCQYSVVNQGSAPVVITSGGPTISRIEVAPPVVCTPPMVLPPGGTQCTTPPGDGGNPPVPKVCKAGEKWVVTSPSGVAPTKNHGGCKTAVVGLLACYRDVAAPFCKWEIQLTGDPAGPEVEDSAPPPGSTPPPETGPRVPSPPIPEPEPGKGCPAGMVQMGASASGAPICIGMGTKPDTAPPKEESSKPPVVTPTPGGGSTSVQETTSKNVDGSTTTTTTTTTTGADGSVTKKTDKTTTGAVDGSPGVPDGEKDGKGFCEQNPTLSICRNSSVSGTCGQISCDGDAIQCATLRAAAAMECREKEDAEKMEASPEKALGKAIQDGQDPMKGEIDTLMKGTDVDFSNPNLDTSGFLGGGQCLAPMTFAVMGKQVTYSFVALCEQIQPLRAVIMAICSILAYLVVARSVLGGS